MMTSNSPVSSSNPTLTSPMVPNTSPQQTYHQSPARGREYKIVSSKNSLRKYTPGLAMVKKNGPNFHLSNQDFCSLSYLQSMYFKLY